MNVHDTFYALNNNVIECAKMAKLLVLSDMGKMGQFMGKRLDELTFDGNCIWLFLFQESATSKFRHVLWLLRKCYILDLFIKVIRYQISSVKPLRNLKKTQISWQSYTSLHTSCLALLFTSEEPPKEPGGSYILHNTALPNVYIHRQFIRHKIRYLSAYSLKGNYECDYVWPALFLSRNMRLPPSQWGRINMSEISYITAYL